MEQREVVFTEEEQDKLMQLVCKALTERTILPENDRAYVKQLFVKYGKEDFFWGLATAYCLYETLQRE